MVLWLFKGEDSVDFELGKKKKFPHSFRYFSLGKNEGITLISLNSFRQATGKYNPCFRRLPP